MNTFLRVPKIDVQNKNGTKIKNKIMNFFCNAQKQCSKPNNGLIIYISWTVSS